MDRVKEIIQELNSIDEHIKIEAKQCTNKVDKSVLETICAFSNEPGVGGGEILLGVSDNPEKEMRYSIQGVHDADKIQKDLASQCATLFNRPIRPLISATSIKGKTVILITVKELDSQLKPLYFKNEKLPQGAWRRIGSTDQRCSDEDIRALHGQSDDFDKLMLEETDLDDLDENAVAHYRRLRAEVNPEAEELTLSDIEMLRAIKAVKKDKNGVWHLTTTGLIVFGKSLALRREMPAMRVDYIRVPGNEWVPDAHNRFASIDMRGPLLLMVSRAYNAIADDLPRGFSLKPGQLQASRPLIIPEDALREAIVNTPQKSSLIFLREIGAVDNITYRQLNGCTNRQASIDLKKLESKGLISPKGHGRNTYYVPTPLFVEVANRTTSDPKVVTSGSNGTTSDPKVATSDSKVVTSGSKVATSDPKVVTSDSKVATSDPILNNISEELKVVLSKIGKKCALTILEELIVELCKSMPLNVEQLSELTHRSIKYLRNKIIPKLMQEKRIRFTIPEMINHPEQKYQA